MILHDCDQNTNSLSNTQKIEKRASAIKQMLLLKYVILEDFVSCYLAYLWSLSKS